MDILARVLAPVNTVRYGSGMDDSKMSRQSWLDAGFERLAVHGFQGLRAMAIAEQLGVTKGSFYWHFKNLREYRAALLMEWERRYTHEAIQRLERTGGDAAAKLRVLISSSGPVDHPQLAFASRSWKISDPLAGRIAARVDDVRIAYVAKLLRELGWAKRDAAILARFAYQAMAGRLMLSHPAPTPAQLDLILHALTSK